MEFSEYYDTPISIDKLSSENFIYYGIFGFSSISSNYWRGMALPAKFKILNVKVVPETNVIININNDLFRIDLQIDSNFAFGNLIQYIHLDAQSTNKKDHYIIKQQDGDIVSFTQENANLIFVDKVSHFLRGTGNEIKNEKKNLKKFIRNNKEVYDFLIDNGFDSPELLI